MENRINKVYLLFKKITGLELDMRKYSHRLMVQKLVYLLQAARVNFGYSFNWYVKGPYCTELANDCFEFSETKEKSEVVLHENEEKIVNSLKQNFKSEVNDDKKLELLGSLVYIENQMDIKGKDKVIQKLISLKPWYDPKDIEEAIDKIYKSDLF